MSSTPTNDEELKDIELCYTAMGLSIGDSPAIIEITYKRLVEMYKANLSAPDHRAREEAKDSQYPDYKRAPSISIQWAHSSAGRAGDS